LEGRRNRYQTHTRAPVEDFRQLAKGEQRYKAAIQGDAVLPHGRPPPETSHRRSLHHLKPTSHPTKQPRRLHQARNLPIPKQKGQIPLHHMSYIQNPKGDLFDLAARIPWV